MILRCYNKAIGLEADPPVAYRNRGMTYHKKGSDN